MYRIAFVIDNLNIHGGVRRCIEVANALISRGHWLTIHTPDGKPSTWLPCAAPVQTYAALAGQRLHAVVCFSHDERSKAAALSCQSHARFLFVVAINEQHPETLLSPPPKTPTARWLVTVQDPTWTILACATWMGDWLRQNVRADAVTVLGGVNRTIFHRIKTSRTPGTWVVLSSGDNREREGSKVVTEAVRLLNDVGKHKTELRTYAGKGHPQERMASVYCEADVFCDAQLYAGWNNPVAEAMACRVPVVCTNIGGVRDFAVHEETALLVALDDAPAMAAAVERVLTDPVLRNRLVDAAHDRIGTFSYANSAEIIERLIDERV